MDVTFKAKPHERDALQEMVDHMFPNDRMRLKRFAGRYVLELTEERAAFLFDQLRIEAELPTFTDFSETQLLAAEQTSLNLGDYDPENPIHATAA